MPSGSVTLKWEIVISRSIADDRLLWGKILQTRYQLGFVLVLLQSPRPGSIFTVLGNIRIGIVVFHGSEGVVDISVMGFISEL